MRLLFLAASAALLGSARPALAQRADIQPPTASSSVERATVANRSGRLACVPMAGKVYDPNGNPLAGATLLIKGTHDIYVTDSEGKYLLSNTVYEGQVLTIGAAGYLSQEVPLTDCTLPRLVLEKNPTAHIKQSGKRVGQVTRLDNRSTNLK